MLRTTHLLILICLIGSACSPKTVVSTPGAAFASLTPVSILQKTTVRPISIVPSATLEITYTASSTPMPLSTGTRIVTLTIAETPTPPGMALLADITPVASSPDGNWLWGIDRNGNVEEGKKLQFNKTLFASKDGKIFWSVWPKTKDIGDIEAYRATYTPIYWLPSEQYVYLVGNFCCADGPYGYTGMNLARLDLRTGAFSIQVSGWSPHFFAFSKTGKFLFDTQYNIPHLRFIRLIDWKITDIPIDPKFIYNEIAIFSPDQDLALVQACIEDGLGCVRYSLLLANIKEKNYRILLNDMVGVTGIKFDDFFNSSYGFTYEWSSGSEVLITAQALRKETYQFILNIDNNQIRKIK